MGQGILGTIVIKYIVRSEANKDILDKEEYRVEELKGYL